MLVRSTCRVVRGRSLRPEPTLVTGIEGATAIAAAMRNTCALIAGGTVRCWGRNGSGELGDGTTRFRAAPVTVTGIDGATAITLGASHACAVVARGEVRCWGTNESGQLGDGSDTAGALAVLDGGP
jgi:alpha-tubulin suppressor-like RCC1 family protein